MMNKIKQTQELINELKEEIFDFEKIKYKILPMVINSKAKQYDEKNIVKINWNKELDIIFRIILNTEDNRIDSCIINQNLINSWKITKYDLYNETKNNVKSNIIYGSLLDTMDYLTKNKMPTMNDFDIEKFIKYVKNENFIILSNKYKTYGSSVLLNFELLELIKKEIGKYYIIPSSIHEIIIIKEFKNMNFDDIKKIIKEINETTVDEKDRLSNELFEYKEKNLIIIK